MISHYSPTGFSVGFGRSQGAIFSDVASHTYLYTILNFPVGAVTVDIVTEEDEEGLKQYQGYYSDFWD